MFQVSGRLAELQLQHRHSDGTWSEFEAAAHDPASIDPERHWAHGEIFVCKACGEEVRVSHGTEPESSTGDTA